jgi:hypothetical protein
MRLVGTGGEEDGRGHPVGVVRAGSVDVGAESAVLAVGAEAELAAGGLGE